MHYPRQLSFKKPLIYSSRFKNRFAKVNQALLWNDSVVLWWFSNEIVPQAANFYSGLCCEVFVDGNWLTPIFTSTAIIITDPPIGRTFFCMYDVGASLIDVGTPWRVLSNNGSPEFTTGLPLYFPENGNVIFLP